MFLAHSMKCTECGGELGAAIFPIAHRDTLRTLEFACVECIEKIAKSEAITLNYETSWGRVTAKTKGR
jgi:hypothetical protein